MSLMSVDLFSVWIQERSKRKKFRCYAQSRKHAFSLNWKRRLYSSLISESDVFFFYYYFVISIKQFVLHDLLFAHLSHALLPPAWQIGNWTLGWKHRAENGSTTIHLAKLLSHQVEGEEWQRGCIIYLVIHGTPLPLSVPVYIYI